MSVFFPASTLRDEKYPIGHASARAVHRKRQTHKGFATNRSKREKSRKKSTPVDGAKTSTTESYIKTMWRECHRLNTQKQKILDMLKNIN